MVAECYITCFTQRMRSHVACELSHLTICQASPIIGIQEQAQAAPGDGSSHPDLCRVAKAGRGGAHPGNICRDLLRSEIHDKCKIIRPYKANVVCSHQNEESRSTHLHVILPHELWVRFQKINNGVKGLMATQALGRSGGIASEMRPGSLSTQKESTYCKRRIFTAL